MRIPPDLQELIDRTAQDDGITRQKKLDAIIEFYFSDRSQESLGASRLAEVLQQELTTERERYDALRKDHETLLGEYALVTTKLLPAAEKTMAPWWRKIFKIRRNK